MKYIRTKDGIYDKVDETLVLASLPSKYELTKNGVHVGYEYCKNCQLADTIEELCDCWIVIDKKGRRFYYEIYETAKKYKTNNEILFGAIWTVGENDEPILKSKAKMNEKEELELL